MMHKVSIIIPCYNYAHFLPDAVKSALGQTFKDIEVIIVNDGSTDDTLNTAKVFEKENPGRLRVLSMQNYGVSAARNAGIALANGDYVLPLDADDLLLPNYVESLVRVLDTNPEVDLAYTWTKRFGDESGIDRNGEFTLGNLIVRNGPPCTMLIRKAAWVDAGGYKTAMSDGGEDWEFCLSLYEAGCKGIVIPEPLFMYRRHGPSRIGREQRSALKITRRLKLLHPAMFEPRLAKLSLRLARTVIWLKSWLRDPVTRFLYVRFPRLHRKLSRIKYDVLGFLWKE